MNNDPARGDTRPCAIGTCEGKMQFGREPMPPERGRESNGGQPGWVCSLRPDHFTTSASLLTTAAAARATARSSWENEGGSSR